jgi:hypothetical protein
MVSVRGTILIGLLLCTATLAGTRLVAARGSSGECEAIELVTNGKGSKPGLHAFRKCDDLHTWSVVDDTLVIESAGGRRVEFAQATVEIFNCALPTP